MSHLIVMTDDVEETVVDADGETTTLMVTEVEVNGAKKIEIAIVADGSGRHHPIDFLRK